MKAYLREQRFLPSVAAIGNLSEQGGILDAWPSHAIIADRDLSHKPPGQLFLGLHAEKKDKEFPLHYLLTDAVSPRGTPSPKSSNPNRVGITYPNFTDRLLHG